MKVDISEIKEFLGHCLAHYHSDAYKAEFGWIDQIKEIRDPAVVRNLNEALIERLDRKQLDKTWMAVPEVVDWVDIKGFRYGRPKTGELVLDLDASAFLDSLGDKKPSLDLLKHTLVHVISARTDEPSDHWSAFKCIYSETELGGKLYVLNGGKWYEIAPDFATLVHEDFRAVPEADMNFPEYDHADVGAYNESLPSAIPNSYCMDRQLIQHGGGHSSIEFCDLATQDKKLVHIKRYSGSSQLSHLFAQGVVSAELFVEDEKFRQALNENLPSQLRLADPRFRPEANEYEVVFGIISKSENPLEIPFFSKVSMRNARRRLRGYGYKVSKKKIQRRIS